MKRTCEVYPRLMLSDIELKYCKGCGIYRSIDKFYMGCNPGNYCIECKREKMAKYNAMYRELMWKERNEKELEKEKEEEQRRENVRAYKRRWYQKKKEEAGKTVRERRRQPKPKEEPTPVYDDLPVGARCNTCKSYSRTSPKDGWCMKSRRIVRGKGCCDRYREDKAVTYELTAAPVTPVNNTPYS